MINYKHYYLRPNSYDYLALNKVLRTNDAKYGYLQEIVKDGILLQAVTVSEATP